MLRPHRQAAIAQACQIVANHSFFDFYAKTLFQNALQVHPAPAHHAVNLGIRALFHNRCKGRFQFRRQRTFAVALATFPKSLQTFAIVMVNPVPQCLPVHAAGFRRRPAVAAVQYKCDRQYPPRNKRILLPLRRRAKLRHR